MPGDSELAGDYEGAPADGELGSDGECAQCQRGGVVLLDGTLCERCHQEVWAEVVDGVQQFAILAEGSVVGVGQAYPHVNGKATLAWLTQPGSVGVYDGLDAVQEMVQENENLRIAYY